MAANTRGIRAGRAFVELGVSDKLSAGLRRAQKRLKAFGDGVRVVGTRLAAIGAAGLAPLAASVRSFAKAGDTLDKMSKRTGVSVEALSELGFAAEQSGADLQTLEAGVRVMQRTLNDAERGLATAKDAMAELGLSADALRGLSPEQQFKTLAEALSRIEDPSKRAAVAMQIFGRAGTRLLPLIEGGADSIEALQEQARSLGLTISTEAAAEAALLTDTLNILWRTVRQGVFVVGSALAPAVTRLAEATSRVVVSVTAWIKANRAVVVAAAKVATIVALVGLTLTAAGLGISVLAAAFGGLATLVTAAGAALGALLSPIGLVVAAVVGLGVAVVRYTSLGGQALGWLMDRFGELRDLPWEDVDLQSGAHGFITVRRGGSTGKTKNRKSRRIPVHAELRPVLAALPRKGELVFPAPATSLYPDGGGPLKERWLINNVKRLCRKCGFAKPDQYKIHTFRHAFASMLAREQVSHRYALEFMGHSSSEILDLYYTMYDDAAEQAIGKIAYGGVSEDGGTEKKAA